MASRLGTEAVFLRSEKHLCNYLTHFESKQACFFWDYLVSCHRTDGALLPFSSRFRSAKSQWLHSRRPWSLFLCSFVARLLILTSCSELGKGGKITSCGKQISSESAYETFENTRWSSSPKIAVAVEFVVADVLSQPFAFFVGESKCEECNPTHSRIVDPWFQLDQKSWLCGAAFLCCADLCCEERLTGYSRAHSLYISHRHTNYQNYCLPCSVCVCLISRFRAVRTGIPSSPWILFFDLTGQTKVAIAAYPLGLTPDFHFPAAGGTACLDEFWLSPRDICQGDYCILKYFEYSFFINGHFVQSLEIHNRIAPTLPWCICRKRILNDQKENFLCACRSRKTRSQQGLSNYSRSATPSLFPGIYFSHSFKEDIHGKISLRGLEHVSEGWKAK